jgi:hypothetical protein
MRIDDGKSALAEVGIYLTSAEVRQMIATLTDLLDDVEGVANVPTSHSVLVDAEREIGVFVYADRSELDADFTANLPQTN